MPREDPQAGYNIRQEEYEREPFHPLDPAAAVPINPVNRLATERQVYNTGYWSDFKAAAGFTDPALNARQQAIRRDEAVSDFAARNVTGGMAALPIAAMMAASSIAAAPLIYAAADFAGFDDYRKAVESRRFASEIGHVVARGTGATLSGSGWGRDDIKGLGDFMIDAAERDDVSLEDLQNEMTDYVNSGLIGKTQSVEEFKRNFSDLKKNVSEIVEVLGKTQEEAVDMLSRLNQQGVTGGMAARSGMAALQASRRTGLPIDTFISAGEATAQSFQGTGYSGSAGYNMGVQNQAAADLGRETGAIGANTMYQFGNTQNLAMQMTQTQVKWLNSPTGDLAIRAAMDESGQIDMKRFMDISEMSFQEQLDIATQNMSKPGGYERYVANEKQAKSSVMENAPSGLLPGMIFKDLARVYGSGGDASRMTMDDLKASAIKLGYMSGDMFDAMAASLTAVTPEILEQEARLNYTMNEEARREFLSETGFWSKLGRASGSLTSRIGGGISDAYNAPGERVSDFSDSAIENFDTWYKKYSQGIVDYNISKEEIGYVVDRVSSGAKVGNVGSTDRRRGFHRDWSHAVDSGELAIAALEHDIFDKEKIGVKTLEEAWRENYDRMAARQQDYKEKHGGELPSDEIDLSQWTKEGMPHPEQAYDLLSGLDEYKDMAVYEDARFFSIRNPRKYIVAQDVSEFYRQAEQFNSYADEAVQYISMDEDRKNALEEKFKKEGKTFKSVSGDDIGWDEIRTNMSRMTKEIKKKYDKATPEEKLKIVLRQSGVDLTAAQKSGEIGYATDMVMRAAELEGRVAVGGFFDPKFTEKGFREIQKVTRISLGDNTALKEKLARDRDRSIDQTVDDLSDLKGTGLLGFSAETNSFFKSDTGQILLDKFYAAHKSGNKQERDAALRELEDAAPADEGGKIRKVFENESNYSEIETALAPRFDSSDGKYSVFETEQYQKVLPEMIATAFSGFKDSESDALKEIYQDASAGSLGFMREIEAGGGLSGKELAKELGAGRSFYEYYSKDGFTDDETRALSSRLLGSNNVDASERLLAYGAMDASDFERVDRAVQNSARRFAAQRLEKMRLITDAKSYFKDGEFIGDDRELRKLSLIASGATGQTAGEVGTKADVSAPGAEYSRELRTYIGQQTEFMRAMMDELKAMKNK